MADSIFDLFKNYDASIAPLRASYQKQASEGPTGIFANVDPVMLGLAQGFLSPTRTGGFGESLGAGLAGAQAPLEAIRKRQMTAQEKLAELEATKLRMQVEAPYREALAEYYRSGGSRGGSDNQNRLLYTALWGDAKKWEWDPTEPKTNPLNGKPFTSEEEMNQVKNIIEQKFYSLGLSEADIPAPKSGQAKSNYSSEDAEGEKKGADTTSAPAVPRDVKARVVGKVYSSPKGLYKWTGEGWEPAPSK